VVTALHAVLLGCAAVSLRVLVALLAILLLGCSTHLAGTNDAALDYAVQADPAPAKTPEPALVAAGVKARLVSAQLAADVDPLDDGHVRVVADADYAGYVDELVTWRGGLAVARVDDSVTIAPRDSSDVQPMSATRPDGQIERWWQGSSEAVHRVANEARLDEHHAVLAQRLTPSLWRTRVVVVPAIVHFGIGDAEIVSLEPSEHGKALALTVAPAGRAPIATERGAHPGADVALVRGNVLVDVVPIEAALTTPITVHFGDDVTAYSRAHAARMLLSSPVLPRLARVAVTREPPRWGVAAACLVLPFVFSFAWLFFVRRFDRARPEPMWLVLATFGLGCLSIVPAGLAEVGLSQLTPWLEPSVVTLGGQLIALPLAIAVYTVVVGVVEEGAKFFATWSLARHRREFDEPVDGIVYACAAALGFAAVENVKYFAFGRMSGAVIAVRAVMTVPVHMFFSTIWGYALGRKLVSRRSGVLGLFLLAALAHGTFDACLSIDDAAKLGTLVALVLGVVFIVLLRKALRHGAVPPKLVPVEEGAPPPTEPLPASSLPRAYHRIGSNAAFIGCAAGAIACAFALTVVGIAYEVLHHRVGIVFVGIATVLLAAFGFATWGAAATIPLDCAIDAQGVTFAGGRTPWSTVSAVALEVVGARAWVRVQTQAGDLRIGPTNVDTARAIAGAIGAARG
jgi:RsiW-degrading membrane proteinase PrsW (M82 family)